MISFEEAFDIVMKAANPVDTERIHFQDALNRVLAEDMKSDMDMPPFDKSAVDGYACRKLDLFSELEVIEVIPAGKFPVKKIGKCECSKIMTGAPVPDGADVVIMVEDVEETAANKIRFLKDKVKNNISFRGEDIHQNDIVLKKGTRIDPQHIAVLAAVGAIKPLLSRKVRIAIISTGDELVEPEQKPGLSQIRNSNAYQLVSQAVKTGAEVKYIGIAEDTIESTRQMVSAAFDFGDIVILTGGVSMGDFDHVPAVLKEMGVELKFESIAVQPGRPTVFGVKGNQYIFGLPGNPVSSFVQFELLVKPLVYKMSGHIYKPVKLRLRMGVEYQRKRSTRLSLVPIGVDENSEIIPLDYHGSAHINALTDAQGLIFIPIGQKLIEKGELVDVRLI